MGAKLWKERTHTMKSLCSRSCSVRSRPQLLCAQSRRPRWRPDAGRTRSRRTCAELILSKSELKENFLLEGNLEAALEKLLKQDEAAMIQIKFSTKAKATHLNFCWCCCSTQNDSDASS